MGLLIALSRRKTGVYSRQTRKQDDGTLEAINGHHCNNCAVIADTVHSVKLFPKPVLHGKTDISPGGSHS